MKRLILSLIVVFSLSISSFALSDIEEHWAKTYIDDLIAKQAISGYPDGTFKPENTVSTAEFTKILVSALGHHVGNAQYGHWASNYMVKARELKLIKSIEDEFNAFDAPITRGMMARMISRAMNAQYDNIVNYIPQIKDYNNMHPSNKNAVLIVYRAGIVTGYPDGSFKDENVATRAEATTMLARLLDKTLRREPELHNLEVDYTEDIYLPSGASFHEKSGSNDTSYDFYISLNIIKPLEPQYRDVEVFLERWFDQTMIDEIMSIVKTKTKREEGLENYLYYHGKKFRVGSRPYNYIIEIKGYMD